jgi:hypothetical protein
MSEAPRTTYERAVRRSHDAELVQTLLHAIVEAIFEASRVSDAKAVVLRTGELTDALVVALASVLALRPEGRVPSQLRMLTEDIGRRLRRDVAQFRNDAEFIRTIATWFDDDAKLGGSA